MKILQAVVVLLAGAGAAWCQVNATMVGHEFRQDGKWPIFQW